MKRRSATYRGCAAVVRRRLRMRASQADFDLRCWRRVELGVAIVAWRIEAAGLGHDDFPYVLLPVCVQVCDTFGGLIRRPYTRLSQTCSSYVEVSFAALRPFAASRSLVIGADLGRHPGQRTSRASSGCLTLHRTLPQTHPHGKCEICLTTCEPALLAAEEVSHCIADRWKDCASAPLAGPVAGLCSDSQSCRLDSESPHDFLFLRPSTLSQRHYTRAPPNHAPARLWTRADCHYSPRSGLLSHRSPRRHCDTCYAARPLVIAEEISRSWAF